MDTKKEKPHIDFNELYARVKMAPDFNKRVDVIDWAKDPFTGLPYWLYKGKVTLVHLGRLRTFEKRIEYITIMRRLYNVLKEVDVYFEIESLEDFIRRFGITDAKHLYTTWNTLEDHVENIFPNLIDAWNLELELEKKDPKYQGLDIDFNEFEIFKEHQMPYKEKSAAKGEYAPPLPSSSSST